MLINKLQKNEILVFMFRVVLEMRSKRINSFYFLSNGNNQLTRFAEQ